MTRAVWMAVGMTVLALLLGKLAAVSLAGELPDRLAAIGSRLAALDLRPSVPRPSGGAALAVGGGCCLCLIAFAGRAAVVRRRRQRRVAGLARGGGSIAGISRRSEVAQDAVRWILQSEMGRRRTVRTSGNLFRISLPALREMRGVGVRWRVPTP